MSQPESLRVALVAGGLSQGGAEKQLVYMARALRQRGVNVRCYCLTQGDFYEEAFTRAGVAPIWIGRQDSPALRLVRLGQLLRAFKPDVVQAGHFFANLYAAIGGRACGAASIGAIRNDGAFELRENRGWGPLLMRLPTTLIANSQVGARHAHRHGRSPDDVIVVPNVIDLTQFDAAQTTLDLRAGATGPLVIAVGRLVWAKRFDLFLAALAKARRTVPELSGVVVGDGPERAKLDAEAVRLGLTEKAVRFVGSRADVPALLRQGDFLVSCSDHEGFPNVLLEAMAARLAVVTTPAGDAASVVLPGVTGHVVPSGDVDQLADKMVLLATGTAARNSMGRAGRKRVELMYRDDALADRLLAAYAYTRSRRGGRRIAGPKASVAVSEQAPLRTSSR